MSESKSSDFGQKIYVEQVKQIYKHIPIGIIATLINSVILNIILWRVVHHSTLIIWFSLILFISFIRYFLYLKYSNSTQVINEADHWSFWHLVSLICSGAGWGSAGIFLFPLDSLPHQIFIAFVLGGMVAGAAGTFSVIMKHFLGYSLLALLPVIMRFFMLGDEIHFAMGGMILLFGLLMFSTAKRINAVTISSLKLQFENEDLIGYLAVEKDRIEKLNEDYKSEIIERKQAEEALQKVHNELESRVKERTAKLKKANEKLKDEIEDRERAEKAMRESETRYRLVAENVNDMIWMLDIKHQSITYISPSVKKMKGYSPEEIMAQSLEEMLTPESYQRVVNVLAKELEEDKEKDPDRSTTLEIEEFRKDGDIIWTEITASFVRDNEKRPTAVLGVTREITERKQAEKEKEQLEAQLARAQKMEAIGTLAGGVAHDLNNVLSGIVSYPDLLLMDLSEDSSMRQPILTIKKSGQKASEIVQDLLTLARRGVFTTEVLNLNQVVNNYLSSLEHERLKEFHPDAKIEINVETNLLNIMGSPVHISKTIMNLVSNAAEAMTEGGNILISTENRYVDKPIGGYDNVKEGDYVVLRVSDTGIGLSSEEMERVFEPFYTKKVMGRSGTGLGMAVVWGTVKDHKGYIDIQSIENRGTTLTLYFPVTRNEMAKEPDTVSIEDYKGDGESILVVDDVEEQKEIASSLIKKIGYSVKAVSSGEEAIDYIKKQSVDLLVLDMIMDPGIDGLETYKRIRELNPGQKAIIASGFSETEAVKEAQRLGAGQYIKKPYTLEKIGLAIKEELGK